MQLQREKCLNVGESLLWQLAWMCLTHLCDLMVCVWEGASWTVCVWYVRASPEKILGSMRSCGYADVRCECVDLQGERGGCLRNILASYIFSLGPIAALSLYTFWLWIWLGDFSVQACSHLHLVYQQSTQQLFRERNSTWFYIVHTSSFGVWWYTPWEASRAMRTILLPGQWPEHNVMWCMFVVSSL